LAENFYWRYQEWAYKHIRPRVIAEELLVDAESNPPPDYKFFVFHGRVRMIQVDVDRQTFHRRSLFNEHWQKLAVEYVYPDAPLVPRPEKLPEMVRIAEMLAVDFSLVRIDLYCLRDRIYFGEITHTPERGLGRFKPKEFDAALGRVFATGQSIPPRFLLEQRKPNGAANARPASSPSLLS
jgi:TupA-like ATPgrasp